MRLLLIYTLLTLSHTLLAQTGHNPFDIQVRTTESVSDSSSVMQPEVSNAFDLDRASVSNSTVADIPVNESQSAVEPDTADTSIPVGTSNFEEQLSSSNPFEVSHIPMRRSQLKEKADAFSPQEPATGSDSTSSGIFIFWFVLISAILLAVVINTKRNIIPALAKSILNENMLKYNYREENGGIAAQYLLLYICFFINAATLLYLLVGKYMGKDGLMVFGYCVAAVVGVYLLKHITIALMGVIFPVNPEASLYNFTIESFNIFAGMVLIPLNLVIAFGPKELAIIFLYIAVIIVCSLLILRTVRGFVLAAPYVQKHLFHFFLYLCAFELVPLMLLVKLVQ